MKPLPRSVFESIVNLSRILSISLLTSSLTATRMRTTLLAIGSVLSLPAVGVQQLDRAQQLRVLGEDGGGEHAEHLRDAHEPLGPFQLHGLLQSPYAAEPEDFGGKGAGGSTVALCHSRRIAFTTGVGRRLGASTSAGMGPCASSRFHSGSASSMNF